MTLKAFAAAVVLVVAGCAGSRVSRYQGTATSDADAKPLQLTLTVTSRADTSFGAYMKVGTWPARSGDGFGWFPNETLNLLTISPAGDTVLWKSSRYENELAGRYAVLGGGRSGEVGYWSARLVHGVSLGAIKHGLGIVARVGIVAEPLLTLLIILAFGWFVARWILRAPARSTSSTPATPFRRDLEGVGGWLAFFVLGQSVTALLALVRIPELWSSIAEGTWDLGGALGGVRWLLVLESVFHVGRIAIPVVGIYLIARRKRTAPRLWYAYLLTLLAYALTDIIAAESMRQQLMAIFARERAEQVSAEMLKAARLNIQLTIFALIWAAYWVKSDRVRLTFGHGALDRAEEPATVSPPPSGESATESAAANRADAIR